MNKHDGAADGGRCIKDIAQDQIKLILGDSELQRFILARSLITATALSGPLYVVLAQRSGGQALDNLEWRLLAAGLAGALSGSFWGMLADRSSRATMVIGALISGLPGFAVLALVTLAPGYATGVLLVVIGAGVGAVSAFSLEAGLLLFAAMALSGAAVSAARLSAWFGPPSLVFQRSSATS